ncbi:MAG: hypothetical protein AAGB03_01280 [Pseudomonadota bacterium]
MLKPTLAAALVTGLLAGPAFSGPAVAGDALEWREHQRERILNVNAPERLAPQRVADQRWSDRRWGYGEARYDRGPLPVRALRRSLRQRGFSDISLRRCGARACVFTAENRRGRDVRVRVNAYSGDIVSVTRLNRGGFNGDAGRYYGFNDIRRELNRHNYRDVRRLSFDNGVYRVAAFDRRGRGVRIAIDARTCRILRVSYLGR